MSFHQKASNQSGSIVLPPRHDCWIWRCLPTPPHPPRARIEADAAQLEIEAVPAECFCAGCEAIVTAADGSCESPTWGAINREWRQGRELPLLSLPLLSLLSLLSLQLA